MKIANPTYDVVFKYLMEDDEIAKDILSVILNEENRFRKRLIENRIRSIAAAASKTK